MLLGYPLNRPIQSNFADWALFGAPRDYNEDGVWNEKHEGLDFAADIGDEVLSIEDGTVVWASNQRRIGGDSLLGNHIIIDHGGGLISWYGHLNELEVVVGQVVLKGEVIGYAGTTGKSTVPHLHVILQHVGHGKSGYVLPDVVDPLGYINLSNGVY